MSSRIYAAEDDDNIREILRCTLESYGYEVEVFESAAPMLERMRQQLPDLVLMDIMMPEMDGMEALRRMKESAQTREVPVIFLTAKSSEVDKVRECGFTVKTAECGAPYFEQAELVLVCRKQYAQPMDPDRMPEDVKEKWYPGQDYHIMYLGEIVEAYQR